MTALNRAGRERPSRAGRRGLVAVGAAITMLPFGAGSASAETFINPLQVCTIPAPPAQFEDRDQIAEIHLPSVDCAVAQGIAMGREGNRYEPKSNMRRDQMASMIARTLEAGGFVLPEPQESEYSDVPNDSTHADAISQLTQINVVEGRLDGTYGPTEFVQRDQMASFIVGAAEYAYQVDETGLGETADVLEGATAEGYMSPFTDVEPGHVHALAIAAAENLIGVVQGGAGGQPVTQYGPQLFVPRDQMASFVVRLLDVTAIPDSTQFSAPAPLIPEVPVP